MNKDCNFQDPNSLENWREETLPMSPDFFEGTEMNERSQLIEVSKLAK